MTSRKRGADVGAGAPKSAFSTSPAAVCPDLSTLPPLRKTLLTYFNPSLPTRREDGLLF